MQQSYSGKDIVKFIAAILWLVMGIIYLTYVFDAFDAMGDLKPYKQYGGSYYKQAMGLYWIMAAIYALAAVITIVAMIYMIKEDVDKFGTVMYLYATGYILAVVIILAYANSISNGSLFASFKYLDVSVTKYIVVISLAAILVVASIYAEGINYKKAGRGELIAGKSFIPIGIYLSSFICILILSSMLKHDLGDYVDVSELFGNAFRSQSGGGIALIIGIHVSCGLYFFLREKYYVGAGAYGSMGYGKSGFGMPPYGTTGYGIPPYGTTGYGVPPYGATGYGVPPYGATGYGVSPYGQTGYPPMGIVPQRPEPKPEQEKEQSENETESEGVAYCSNCGTMIEKSSKFCYVCGFKLN